MKVVLAGGTGALGRRLADDFAGHGHEVVILTRRLHSELGHRQVEWDGTTLGTWAEHLEGSVLVNLAGELVDRRPTPRGIALLTESRTTPTRTLSAAAEHAPPSVWIQMSTLAIYGDAGDAVLDETAPLAEGPPQMAGVARAWEEAARDAPVERQVILRTGIVFDAGTPALDRLVGLVRWGLGGRVGAGRQWVSWIHIADYLAIVRRAVDDTALSGIVHATSPYPVQNAELMATLRHILRRPGIPTPAAIVRMGAVALRTDPALALAGRRCVPGRLIASGFSFANPQLEPALHDLLRRE